MKIKIAQSFWFSSIILILVGFFLPLMFNKIDPHCGGYPDEIKIEKIYSALNVFRLDNQRYPSTEEGLVVLIIKPGSADMKNWQGPYFQKKLPKDSWGNKFYYYLDKKSNFPRIYSMGKNQRTETSGNDPDDINNWDKEKKWRIFYKIEGATQ
jgi:general secretion pathway protein G